MSEITRSAGVVVPGAMGYVVGGGHSGATDEFDAQVQAAAGLLRDAYGMDVTIRFNSDRGSGGAWLVTDANDRIGSNADIGICVALNSIKRLRALFAKFGGDVNERFAEDGVDAAALEAQGIDTYLTFYAHIGNRNLKDHSVADSLFDDPKRAYAHTKVGSIGGALEFLLENAIAPEQASIPGMR